MVISDKHSKEIYWIQRRLKFLQELDQLLQDDASPDQAVQLADQFRKVENPGDLVERLKEIYGGDLK